jgi:hypothetical protein
MCAMAVPAARRKKNKQWLEKVRELLGWIKAIGIGSTVLGGIVLTQTPELFYYCVSAVYIGIVLIGLDLCFEPFIKRWKLTSKIITGAFFAGVLTVFSYAVVFVESPLAVSAMMTDAEYPAGTTIAGIAWRPEFTEVQVWLTNTSNRAYEDLNILLRPSSPVAAIAQLTTIGGVSFEDKNAFTVHMADINLGTQKKTAISLDLLATDAGYRIRCDHVPAHTVVKVVLALADMKWPAPLVNPQSMVDKLNDKNYILRTKFDDFSTYWQGHIGGDVYAPRPTSSEWLQVNGSYIGAQRMRSITQKVEIGGQLSIKQR